MPSKRAFEKYKPQGLLSEFYRIVINLELSVFSCVVNSGTVSWYDQGKG